RRLGPLQCAFGDRRGGDRERRADDYPGLGWSRRLLGGLLLEPYRCRLVCARADPRPGRSARARAPESRRSEGARVLAFGNRHPLGCLRDGRRKELAPCGVACRRPLCSAWHTVDRSRYLATARPCRSPPLTLCRRWARISHGTASR